MVEPDRLHAGDRRPRGDPGRGRPQGAELSTTTCSPCATSRVRLVPPQDWIGFDQAVRPGRWRDAPGTLTVERAGAGAAARGQAGARPAGRSGSPSDSRSRPACPAGSTSRATASTPERRRRSMAKRAWTADRRGRCPAAAPERARRPTRSISATCTFFPGPSAYLERSATGVRPGPDRPAQADLRSRATSAAVAEVYPQLTGDMDSPTTRSCSPPWSSQVGRLDIGLRAASAAASSRAALHRHRHPGARPAHPAPRGLLRLGLAGGDRQRRAVRPCRPDGAAAGRSSSARPLAAPPPTRSSAPPRRAASPPSICATKG